MGRHGVECAPCIAGALELEIKDALGQSMDHRSRIIEVKLLKQYNAYLHRGEAM